MKILVTGASGFIGKNVLLALPPGSRAVATYHRDGFVLIPGAFSPDEVRRMRKAADEMLARQGHVWRVP